MVFSLLITLVAGMAVCDCTCHRDVECSEIHHDTHAHNHLNALCNDISLDYNVEYIFPQSSNVNISILMIFSMVIALVFCVTIATVIIRRLLYIWREYDLYRGFCPDSLLFRAPTVLI